MGKFKVDLSQGLTDDMFQVHEEILDENSLFKLHVLCDKIVNDNPKAKHDGGFKIRLPESLQGTRSTLKDFWTKFENASHYLSGQYLTRDENTTGILKLHSRKVSAIDSQEFKRAAKDPVTFDTSRRNCCMQALDNGGPKAAVIHFYNCLFSKAIVNDTKTTEMHKSAKTEYQERQSMLVDQDPSLTCVRIERSMKDRKYFVQNDSASTPSTGSIPSDQGLPSLKALLPSNLKQDGDGDNCSLYFNGIEETGDNYLCITSNFAFAHLCHLNMLTDLPQYFPGIAYPFIYLGGLHSVFAIHIEDMSLWSINYNHFGYPKLIILIAPSELSRLSLLLANYGLCWTGKDCIQQLFHKTDIVCPQWLLEHGVKFKVIIQHPGEFVVFAPNAAHTGGNMGPNLAEACNFGSYDWLPFGSVASHGRCDCIESGVRLDVTQLIRDHRRELLPYHKDKSMWTSYEDDHFQRSLIIPQRACYSSTSDVAIPVKATTSALVPYKSKAQPCMVCPVKACKKVFKRGLQSTLVSHINQRHPDCVNDKTVKQYLRDRFPKCLKQKSP